jgi:hypothetical protein
VFVLVFVFDPLSFLALVERGFGQSAAVARTVRGCLADSPRAPHGRSIIRGSLLEVLLAFSDSPRLRVGRSAVRVRTVRGSRPDSPVARADSPPLLAGRSARAWLLCSLVRFIPPSFELPRVLQGIVPKT